MTRITRRKNRTVKPFRGQLYDMVLKNFAYVPVMDAMGRKVKEKGKVKKVRRKEVCDAFEIYYNLCLVDEYFKMLYEAKLAGDMKIMSTLEKDFSNSWKYLLRKYASKAPRGMRELALKVENRIGEIDKAVNFGVAGILMGKDINEIMGKLKGATASTDFKKTVTFYAEFLKQVFAMLGFNVVVQQKSNPKFNIKYIQFSTGDEISEMIASSSSMVAKEIEEADKLKKLRDAKLKSDLLKQGFYVATQPVFVTKGQDKGKAYLTVAYDPRVTQIPKPRNKPNPPKFTKKEYEMIVQLEKLVDKDTIYGSGIDPEEFFKKPKCSIEYDDITGEPSLVYETGEREKNENIIQQLKIVKARSDGFSIPQYKEGFGLNSDGEPEAGYYTKGALKGRPIFKYVVPKTKTNVYARASKIFSRLLALRVHCENLIGQSKEAYEYKKAIEPFIQGVYSSEFTDDLGITYKKFDNMKQLAKKVIKKRKDQNRVLSVVPDIKTKTITVDNYPTWDSSKRKVVYGERKLKIAEFKYPTGHTYQPVHHKELLDEALERIRLGKRKDLSPELQEKALKPVFREIKAGGDEITKTFQLATLKDSSGEDIQIIVAGRYAGYELKHILNMEGRFLEGGYLTEVNGRKVSKPIDRIAFDKKGNVKTVDAIKEGDKWVYEQRLIEPYISYNAVKKQLVLGLPGGRQNKLDRNLMKDLSNKVSSITKDVDKNLPTTAIQNLNPFYNFSPEDFEIIRETLGSVAMSREASKVMDEYYASLRAKENAMTVENTERFTPEALGGFVKKTGRGPFKFNNKQKEAAAWLEASNMRGVIALDTGVGKTLTSLVSIKKAINEGMELGGKESKRRFLFVSPKSLVGNLKKEVLNFMVEGGETFVRADGEKELTPNWQKIVLSRIDEMSYEDFVSDFAKVEDEDNLVKEMEGGNEATTNALNLSREVKYRGKEATIFYEVVKKGNREIHREEIDFKVGNHLETTRTASATSKSEVRELVSYPSLDGAELDAKRKELSKARSVIRKMKKVVKGKVAPKVKAHYEKKYYACFFDEINEIFGKGGSSKKYAISSLDHPRKIFLTASALDRDPIDLFRLSTMAKGKIPTAKQEKAFAEKYGVTLNGRMVALKPNQEVRTQFYNWVKENAYFAPKKDISQDPEFGVAYKDVNLPELQALKSRTITTKMPLDVQREYKKAAKKISGELKAMLVKYRDLRAKLAEASDRVGDLYDSKNSKPYQDLTKATKEVAKYLNKLVSLSNGTYKAKVASKIYKDDRDSRFIYFTTSKSLAKKIVKANSKIKREKIHVLLWSKEILIYKNGDCIKQILDTDNMSVEQLDSWVETSGKSLWSELPKTARLKTADDEDMDEEPTWAMDISKRYVKENASCGTVVCSDNYARGFNFQTFTKVVHLDRGKGFDSELLKQRTARAYRGGQAEQVEEIFIDATLTENTNTESNVSDSALYMTNLENARSLDQKEVLEGKPGDEYQEWIWDNDAWIEMGQPWSYPEDPSSDVFKQKLKHIFFTSGIVRPVPSDEEGGEPIKRIVLLKGVDPKDRAKFTNTDYSMISIDQIKSIVNDADQDFFQDIIYNGLKSDLTGRLDARISDSGIAIKTPDLMRFVLDPTEENLVSAEKALQEYEANPLDHITYDPSRYDDSDIWLSSMVEGNQGSRLSSKTKQILDLVGGPSIMDYHLGDASVQIHTRGSITELVIGRNSRFSSMGRVQIHSDHIYNSIVELTKCAPRGYSSKFLFAEIVTAKKMGLSSIRCEAAGSADSGSYSGFATWPKFGFTCPINLKELLNKVPKTSNDQVYVQAVQEILGSQTNIDLQKLLVCCADIVTVSYDKQELKAYKEKLKLWEQQAKQVIGTVSEVDPNPKLMVGDKVKVKGSVSTPQFSWGSVRRFMVGVIRSVDEGRGIVVVDFPEAQNGWKGLIQEMELIEPRYIEVVDQQQLSMYEAENPKPKKPKSKETVEEKVAVGEKLWAIYGSGRQMTLHLKSGTPSMKIANAYIKKKALEKNVEVQDFLNMPTDLFNTEDPWCWEQEIDKVKVKGQTMLWSDVVKQYPDAFRTAWYAHKPLRNKVEILCRTDKEFQKFMSDYKLIDPNTDFTTPSPKDRAQQSRVRGLGNRTDKEFQYQNPKTKIKLGSQTTSVESDKKLWEESQDPALQAVWEELRLANYAGRIVAELIETEDDPDLIEAQRIRKAD